MTPPRTPMRFYRGQAGTEPVRSWLQGQPQDDRRAIGQDLMRAQFRWPIGMPLCRPMSAGLFEIRTDLAGHRTARVLICHQNGTLFALHGFIKKTQKTPPADLKIARQRQKEIENG